jgi:CHAD domain-containing protein
VARILEPGLEPDQSFRSAMRDLIAARWGVLWRTVPAALAGDDIEGVHDVRVASRRLRAAMDVAADAFPPSWYRPLHREAKGITGALGEVRDRDVMLAFLTEERERVPAGERPGLDRLIARIEREQAVAREEMFAFFAALDQRDVAKEAVRRFGDTAAPPPKDDRS